MLKPDSRWGEHVWMKPRSLYTNRLKSVSLFAQRKVEFNTSARKAGRRDLEIPVYRGTTVSSASQWESLDPRGGDFLFLFSCLSSTHRPRWRHMLILPVFPCPYKNSGNGKSAHCWQLLSADVLNGCDGCEWGHYVGYVWKLGLNYNNTRQENHKYLHLGHTLDLFLTCKNKSIM